MQPRDRKRSRKISAPSFHISTLYRDMLSGFDSAPCYSDFGSDFDFDSGSCFGFGSDVDSDFGFDCGFP